jgi:hypothetical protein
MRNHRSHPTPRRWPSRTLAAALALAAFAPFPALASADTGSPADQPSDLSLTFTGQTGTTAWSANGLTVTANASTTDASSPIEKVVCSVDQGAATTTIGAQQKVPVSGNGAHIVECYPIAWDGTQGAAQFTTVQIDDQIPTVTLTGTSPSPTWNDGSATVTAVASEPQALAGVQSVTCLDGAGDTTSTPGSVGSITVSGTQRYTVSCYATTNAGVDGSRTYEQVWVDNTAPQITYANAPDPTQWYNAGQPVQINVQTPVGGAPIQSLTCDYAGQAVLAGGQLTEQAPPALHNWSVALTLPSTGPGTLNCFAADAAGNLSPVTSTAQQVDTTPPSGVFVTNPNNPTVILAKVSAGVSGVYGANIQYEQKGAWITLPTTLDGGTARAVIPARNPITVGQHALRVVVTDNADNQYVGYEDQNGQPASLDYPVAAGLHLLYTIVPSGTDIYGHPAANTDTDSTVRLAYGHGAVISGQLYTTARSLLANEPIGITVRLADGKHYFVLVRTDRSGDWRYRLPAGGNRTVKVAFGGSVGLQPRSHHITVVEAPAIRLAVHPMKAGGEALLTARVLGRQIPSRGLGLVAQWRPNAGSPWQTLRRLQTRADGRVSARFSVSALAAGSRLQLRVCAPGASSPVLDAKVA